MDNIVVSQVLQTSASQLELDRGAKAQSTNLSAQALEEGAFATRVQLSLSQVQEMLATEKEDPILEEDEEKQDEKS